LWGIGVTSDPGDLHAHVLQGANGGVTARARAADDDVELADAELAGAAGRLLGGDLGGVGGRLAGTLEADRTARTSTRRCCRPRSVMLMMVLLKLALMCASPCEDVLALATAYPLRSLVLVLP
jgi:hypothetical protein